MEETLKIILKEKEFEISSDFRYFNDLDPTIRQILLTDKQYVVQSDVHEETLKSFINFWIRKEIPELTADNLSEYDQLSQEFDLMKEVLLIYKRSLEQIEIKENQNKQQNIEYQAKESKFKKIINILLNKSFSQKLKSRIFDAIQEDDIDKINFYTQQTAYDFQLLYIINKKDQTAGVILCEHPDCFVEIPESINVLFEKYPVTTIYEAAFIENKKIKIITFSEHSNLREIQNDAFIYSSLQSIVIPKSVKKIGQKAFSYCHHLKSVDFEKGSELNYIGESAFYNCSISSLSIPSNYIEFENDWCNWTQQLNTLKVSPTKQKCIALYDKKFLVMKSDPKSEIFDVLLLAPRNIERVVIPPFIRIISENAFSNCSNLEQVECSSDSNLKIIGQKAFSFSSIKKLTIPSCVESFEHEWCEETFNLTEVNILQTDKKNIMLYQDKIIFGKSDLNSDNFDVIYFACRDIIGDVIVPSFIKEIRSYAFDGCQLQNITFSEDSEFFLIDDYAFHNSKLKRISIPYRVSKINNGAFVQCEELEHIDIPINSELREFGESSLYWISIKSLYIPSKVESFGSDWCDNTSYLNNITISPSNKNFIYFDEKYIVGKSDPSSSVYDVLVFSRRDIQIPIIPSFIKKIGSCAFNFCKKLETVVFSKDSKLEVIDENAFSCSSIKRITLPSSLKEIKYQGFDECWDLKIVVFEENCQLESIESDSFYTDPITSFILPPHLKKFNNASLSYNEMQIIEISEDFEMKSLSFSNFFDGYSGLIMIPAKIRNEINFIDQISEFYMY